MFHVRLWLGVAAAGLALFFALANLSLRNFSRARLEGGLARRGRRRDLERVLARHEELLRSSALLYAVSLVAMTALVLAWAHAELEGPAAWVVGAAAAGALAITLGGAIPMAWARVAPESVLVAVLPILCVCATALGPVGRMLGMLDALVRRLAGVPAGAEPPSHIEEELRTAVREGRREGTLEEHQKDMIEGAIRFRKTDASEIMTTRTDIVSLDADASPDEGRRLILTSGHSRIPVTAGSVDTIVGILYAKDLLAPADEGSAPRHARGGEQGRTAEPARPVVESISHSRACVRDRMRPPLFVPATKRLDELLAEFRRAKIHLAVVLDEYGGTAGLVTLEDVVEEIFGEITDEYEESPPQPIRRVGPGTFEVEARAGVDELNGTLALNLPEDEDYETIGGFVLSRLGYIPRAGETLEYGLLRITVLEADERRINRLRLERVPADPGGA